MNAFVNQQYGIINQEPSAEEDHGVLCWFVKQTGVGGLSAGLVTSPVIFHMHILHH